MKTASGIGARAQTYDFKTCSAEDVYTNHRRHVRGLKHIHHQALVSSIFEKNGLPLYMTD
jgi:hypothetical protein